MTKHSRLLLCVFAAVSFSVCAEEDTTAVHAATAANGDKPEFDFGFFASRDRTLDGGTRLRILGPLYESRISATGSSYVACRPLGSRIVAPAERRSRTDVLWPLASSRTVGRQRSWRVLNVMGTDFDTEDPQSRWRLWALPFLFLGRDIEGEDYAGLFPVIGDVHEVLTVDSAEFLLFPLYSKTERAGITTRHIAFPVFSVTKGSGVSRIRVFPLYGHSVSEGSSEARGRMERTFVLWPLWSHVKIERRSKEGFGYVLFPIYGRSVADDLKTWTVLPPFIRWRESKDGREFAVWPMLVMSRGTKDQFYAWPFMGVKSEPGIRSSFVAWPLIHHHRRTTSKETTERFLMLPFVQRQVRKKLQQGDEAERVVSEDVKIWPLASYRRRGERSLLRAPDLWPVMNINQVERNYAPLWTLYSRERVGDAVETELLWGLYRQRKTEREKSGSIFPLVSWRRSRENEGDRKWSLLGGLVGYQREGGSRRLQLLYVIKLRGGADSEAGQQ